MKGKNIVIEIDNFDVIKDKEIQGCIIRCSNDEGNYIVGCRMPEDSNEIKDYVKRIIVSNKAGVGCYVN